jgi:hypothetical protein
VLLKEVEFMNILPFMPKNIHLKYNESFGLDMDIDLRDEMYSGEHHCKISIYNRNLIEKDEQKVIEIEYDYFIELYNEIINLNFNELIVNSGSPMAIDGSRLEIGICYGSSWTMISIWCYKNDKKKRSLENINKIVNGILEKCNLNNNWIEKYIKNIK